MSEVQYPLVSLRDVATDIRDGSHATHPRVPEGFLFLSAKNIGENGKLVIGDSEDQVDEFQYNLITSAFAPKAGDLLVTIVGTVGRRALFDGSKAAFQRSVAFVRSSSAVIPEYLFHAAGDALFTRQLHRRSNVTAQAGLYLGELAKIKIPLPEEETQRRIATILTTLDEVIEATEKLVEKHQQIKAGLMHDLFTRGLWTRPELDRGDHHGLPCEATAQEGQLRPTPEEAPGLYHDSPLGLIPKAWDVKTIQDVIEIQRGFAFSSSDYQSTGILNFRVSNVGLSNEDLRNTEYLPPSFWTTFSQQQLLGGEIVIVMVGATTGKIGRVPEELCPALLNQNLWHLRTKSGFDREFAWNAMPMIVAGHMRLSQGSARDFLKQSDFNKTLTICPAIDEQRGITAALNSISHRIDREQQLNRKLRQQKQGLMHDLLTGRVRV